MFLNHVVNELSILRIWHTAQIFIDQLALNLLCFQYHAAWFYLPESIMVPNVGLANVVVQYNCSDL